MLEVKLLCLSKFSVLSKLSFFILTIIRRRIAGDNEGEGEWRGEGDPQRYFVGKIRGEGNLFQNFEKKGKL